MFILGPQPWLSFCPSLTSNLSCFFPTLGREMTSGFPKLESSQAGGRFLFKNRNSANNISNNDDSSYCLLSGYYMSPKNGLG